MGIGILKWSTLVQNSFISVFLFVLVIFSSQLTAERKVEGTEKLSTKSGLPARQNTITVLTYNIQQLGYANWMANHFERERLALIPTTLMSLKEHPDILVFQEVFTDYAYELVINKLADSYPYHTEVGAQDCGSDDWASVAGDCQLNTWKGNSGVLILSRWPILAKHAYVYNAVRVSGTFDFLAQKGVVYAKIALDEPGLNQFIHILGTHLQADSESHDIRMSQLAEMHNWFNSFDVPKSEAVILAGDFNVSSRDSEKFAELLKETHSNLVLPEGPIGSKSPGSNRYLRMISSSKTEKTVDYILYRTDHLAPENRPVLKVLNFKSIKPWQGERLFGNRVEMNDLSDHYPTFMVFNYNRH
jgi:phospholipase C